VGWILDSYRRAWHRPLLAGLDGATPLQAAQELFAAATVVLAHDGGADPQLVYANAAALRLWRRPWDQMVGMPSRLTAEPQERRERAAVLAKARQCSALRGYSGIRIDSQGGRFALRGARIWSVGTGQAAAFDDWYSL
jgi:hypothetical protein